MRVGRTYELRPAARTTTFVAVAWLLLMAMAWLLSGCIVWNGAPGASGGASEGSGESSGGIAPVACPRAPDKGALASRMLSADELKRATEVCQWNVALYKERGWNVLYTVQMPSGDIYDYLEVSGTASPDPTPPPMMSDPTLPPGFGLLPTELDLNPAFGGLKGTHLRVRSAFSRYVSGNTGATSLEDFLTNYQPAGTPTGAGRLYAGIKSTKNPVKNMPLPSTPNLGASAWVMPYVGTIEEGTMSLLEMAVGCRNTALPGYPMEQQIGVAAAMDYADARYQGLGDSVLRLQVEFMTHSDSILGPGKGGWHGANSTNDFHPYPSQDNTLTPGMRLYPSTVGGPGFATLFWIRLWNKNWWIGVNGAWIGYYPNDPLFVNDSQFSENACEALWYTEAYNPGYDVDASGKVIKAAPKWPPTGSGYFAAAGWGKASFFADPIYLDMSLTPQSPYNGDPLPAATYNDHCYTSSGLVNGVLPAPPVPIVYVGGPGSDAPANACPAPAPPSPPSKP